MVEELSDLELGKKRVIRSYFNFLLWVLINSFIMLDFQRRPRYLDWPSEEPIGREEEELGKIWVITLFNLH